MCRRSVPSSAPEPQDRRARPRVARVGLELHTLAVQPLEGVREQQQLGLALSPCAATGVASHVHPISARRWRGSSEPSRVLPTTVLARPLHLRERERAPRARSSSAAST
jgi:hypothetical protein